MADEDEFDDKDFPDIEPQKEAFDFGDSNPRRITQQQFSQEAARDLAMLMNNPVQAEETDIQLELYTTLKQYEEMKNQLKEIKEVRHIIFDNPKAHPSTNINGISMKNGRMITGQFPKPFNKYVETLINMDIIDAAIAAMEDDCEKLRQQAIKDSKKLLGE